MYRSYVIIIRKSLASLILAAAVLTGAFGAGALISDSPTYAVGDGFVWPNGAATVDGNH